MIDKLKQNFPRINIINEQAKPYFIIQSVRSRIYSLSVFNDETVDKQKCCGISLNKIGRTYFSGFPNSKIINDLDEFFDEIDKFLIMSEEDLDEESLDDVEPMDFD